MKLGILVNTDRHANDLVSLTDAAVSKGHEVAIFFMDAGVRLLEDTAVTGLCGRTGVVMSYCDYSVMQTDVSKDGCPENIACGSQYDNVTMQHESDRVIVL
jgi:predicted peroxiredoxin